MRRSGPEIVLQLLALLQAVELVVQRVDGDGLRDGLLGVGLQLDGLALGRAGDRGEGGEGPCRGLGPVQRTVGHHSLPSASIEHRLDVLPGVDNLVVRVSQQSNVTTPGVEVSSVRLDVFTSLGQAVRVKYELHTDSNTPISI